MELISKFCFEAGRRNLSRGSNLQSPERAVEISPARGRRDTCIAGNPSPVLTAQNAPKVDWHVNGVKRALLRAVFLLFLAFPLRGFAQSQWVLDQSTLSYHISHPLHQIDGVSHAARGKGICSSGQCDFLIAVPVKSFDSGDSNRDLHMLQATRGAEFPMVIVRTRVPEAELNSPTISLDVEIQFVGQTVHYNHIPFQRVSQGNEVRVSGMIPATLSDFKIDPPTLLTIPVKNETPVRIDMTWRPQ